MKRKGISKQTIARYMAAFIEIKAAIDANPKCQTSQICRQFKIGQHPVTMLKKTGVIVQKNGRKKWVGNEPNVEMVVQIAEAIHNYHAELRSRGLKGEMFDRKNKAVETTNAIKPTQSDVEAWKTRYSEQKAPKTDIQIQNTERKPYTIETMYDDIAKNSRERYENSLKNSGEIESSKPIKKRFDVKIFGIKLFSFNY
jgi:hypothetical protein